MPRYTLSKNERLSSIKEIDQLFAEGKSIASQPIRLIWRPSESMDPSIPRLKAMFSVSKRKFPHAVDRNRIRRLLRENYRLLKPALTEQLKTTEQYHLAFLFIGTEMPGFDTIQKAMSNAFERWFKKINSSPPADAS